MRGRTGRAALDHTIERGCALVAVQWRGGEPDDYFSPLETYSLVALALRYMTEAYGADPGRTASRLQAQSRVARSRSRNLPPLDRRLSTAPAEKVAPACHLEASEGTVTGSRLLLRHLPDATGFSPIGCAAGA